MMAVENIPDSVRIAIESLGKPYGLSVESLQKKASVEKRFVDVKGAVNYTTLSRCTLGRAVSTGKLSCIKMHPGKTGKVLFDVKDLDKFILGCRCRGGA